MSDDLRPMIDEFAVRFEHLRRPAIRLDADHSGNGFSRFGGLPEMPADIKWPVWKRLPQTFIAQIFLAEASAALPSFLPDSGYLYFFFEQEHSIWGMSPKEKNAWRVIYIHGDRKDFVHRPAPKGLPLDCVYRPKPVLARRVDLLPAPSCTPEGIYDYDRDGDAYDELRGKYAFNGARGTYGELGPWMPGSGVLHQMLGYHEPLQGGEMELYSQLLLHGLNPYSRRINSHPRLESLAAGANDWKLLLQVDSDTDIGWMWGDMGVLYFWIRESDARCGDFSKVWLHLECG